MRTREGLKGLDLSLTPIICTIFDHPDPCSSDCNCGAQSFTPEMAEANVALMYMANLSEVSLLSYLADEATRVAYLQGWCNSQRQICPQVCELNLSLITSLVPTSG